jgi:hypothetical protein
VKGLSKMLACGVGCCFGHLGHLAAGFLEQAAHERVGHHGQHALVDVLADAGHLRGLRGDGARHLLGAEQAPEHIIAVGNALRREGLAHVFEIFGIVAGGDVLHHAHEIVGVGCAALEA